MAKVIGSKGVIDTVSCSTSSTELAPANDQRTYLIVHNAASANMYLAYGEAASSTNFSVLVASGESYEVPSLYRGAVFAALASGTGDAYVTTTT